MINGRITRINLIVRERPRPAPRLTPEQWERIMAYWREAGFVT